MRKYLLFLIPVIFVACSTCNIAKQTSIQEIHFGHGGGVTQSIERYAVKPDGRIYQGKDVICKVNKKDLAHIYERAASVNCEPFNMPSNTFSFVCIIKNDTSLYYCWDGVAPLPIMVLDSELYKLLPK